MALALIAKLTQHMFDRARNEARESCTRISAHEREALVGKAVEENVRRSRDLWYQVRDEALRGNKIFSAPVCREHGLDIYGEPQDAPQSTMELGYWFVERFYEEHTFFVERAGRLPEKIGTARPLHVR